MSSVRSAPIRIANCSGFYGDRRSAAAEMVNAGPIDVLTGDWLAELTMVVLTKSRMRDPGGGWAKTFVAQMEEVLGTCLDRDIKVVSNAGGLNPRGCAEAVEKIASTLGIDPVVAYVEGDGLLSQFEPLRRAGHPFRHLDTGEEFGAREPLTANVYTGAWGVAEALVQGANVVITGRITDASLVVGPAAWHYGWKRDDWDRLAGAVVAGHIIECGPQATGGNYCFYREIPGLEHPGFPIAEVYQDGSSVITKHPGTGGAVTRGTVTAQLVYEIAGPEYLGPDVTARFDTIRLQDAGEDRVRVFGVRGQPPPATAKVGVTVAGGYRTTVIVGLTGLDIEHKADLLVRTLWAAVPGGRESFASTVVELVRSDHEDPESNSAAIAQLRITVMDPDQRKVGRAFTSKLIEIGLGTVPGLVVNGFNTNAESFVVYWPTTIPAELVQQEVVCGDRRTPVAPTLPAVAAVALEAPEQRDTRPLSEFETIRVPLGTVMGARSGDKGGNANLGVWAPTQDGFEWLAAFLTVDRIRELLPDTRHLRVDRHVLPHIRAMNFVIHGLLGQGVSASTRVDPQAKGLGEYLRAKIVPVPASLERVVTSQHLL